MKRYYILMSLGISLLITFFMMLGCTKEESIVPQNDNQLDARGLLIPTTGSNVNFYALTDRNELAFYKAGPPAQFISLQPILGLAIDEHMMAIDFRPSNGILYGVTNLSMIYAIDPGTGQTKPISRAPFEPVIKGSTVGFDFDPVADQIRLVTDEEQNMRIDPDQGIVISVDNDLVMPEVAMNSIAYTRMYTPARTFLLYDIDAARGALFLQEPNSGKLSFIGSLGLVIKGEGGFDIGGLKAGSGIKPAQKAETGFAVLFGHSLTGGVATGDNLTLDAYRIYEINLQSGKATYKGKLFQNIIGIAIP